MKKELINNELAIFQGKNGEIILKEDFENETIWANQKQIAEIFNVDVKTINEHLKNIYKEGELNKKGTILKFQIVQKEGIRNVKREVIHYNLDSIISVGYRVNSKKATQFRIWATSILKEHITQGFTINKNQIKNNYNNFLKVVEDIKKLTLGKDIGNDDVLIFCKYLV